MKEFEIYYGDLNAEAQQRFKTKGFWHENIDLAPLAIIELEEDEDVNHLLRRVPFISVWDGGIEIATSAIINIETGEVNAIDAADKYHNVELCEEQYIMNGVRVCVYEDKKRIRL